MYSQPEHLGLGLDGHAESEGDEDVQKRDGPTGDGQTDHKVLVALDHVFKGDVAALEVVTDLAAVIIGIGLSTVLDKGNEIEKLQIIFN